MYPRRPFRVATILKLPDKFTLYLTFFIASWWRTKPPVASEKILLFSKNSWSVLEHYRTVALLLLLFLIWPIGGRCLHFIFPSATIWSRQHQKPSLVFQCITSDSHKLSDLEFTKLDSLTHLTLYSDSFREHDGAAVNADIRTWHLKEI